MKQRKYITAVAVSLALNGPPAALAAGANLAIAADGNGKYLVTVSGKADHVTRVTERNLSVKLRGDDQWSDDHLFDVLKPLKTNPDGSFFVQFTLPGYTLNEDWGRDEVYAEAFVFDPSRGTKKFTTSNVNGYY